MAGQIVNGALHQMLNDEIVEPRRHNGDLQALGIDMANQLMLMLPYIMTIAALIFASKKAEFPSAYTIPYSRLER